MVQRTFEMLDKVDIEKRIVIATGSSQVASLEAQLSGDYEVVVEPERRDTAPAIMLSASYLALSDGASLDDTVVVMPIDTFADQAYYDLLKRLHETVQSDFSDLVLLGAKPTYPSEKFGYICPGEGDAVRRVIRFVEKPSEPEAKKLIAQQALWNCGVFAFKLGYLTRIVEQYHQLDSFEVLRSDYARFPKNSFDYEVVEKANSVSVLTYEGTWKDLGTWNTLTEEMVDYQAGYVVCDDDCVNTHIINETGLPMVVAGVHDAVVVATPDGILVSDKMSSAHIKPYVTQAAETRPMYESRQWGEYKVLSQESNGAGMCSLEKLLIINKGKQLSYQRHAYRSEVWMVTEGTGEVVLDGEVQPVARGSVISVSAGKKHAVRAIDELHIFEVQLGSDLVEEDIERFGFYWH